MTSAIMEVRFDRLHLDLENPRLPEGLDRTPKSVLTWIAKTTAIEDLMNAIGTNGFFPGEPLVVYPHPSKRGDYVVIEGNRRLTAVKLLHNPSACEKPSQAIIEIAQAAEHVPTDLPVVVRPTRQEVLPYLGYRHITGIKEWDPLQKARYLKQLFDETSRKLSPRERYLEVARTIGSRRDHVKRNLDALAVYQHIQAKDFYEIEGLGEESIKFSILSTALADDRIGYFVGVAKRVGSGDEADFEPTNPIVSAKSLNDRAVSDLTHWLFEKGDGKRAVVGESRKLRELGAVVVSPKALAALRSNSTLSYAYRLTVGIGEDFKELLYTAQSGLEEAASLAPNVDYDGESYQLAREIFNLVKSIGITLRNKQAGDEDVF